MIQDEKIDSAASEGANHENDIWENNSDLHLSPKMEDSFLSFLMT